MMLLLGTTLKALMDVPYGFLKLLTLSFYFILPRAAHCCPSWRRCYYRHKFEPSRL